MSIRSLLGFEPLPVPPHVFWLEPGHLTYGRFVLQPDGFELVEHRAAELAPDLFQRGRLGGPMREPEGLGQALAGLLEGIGESVQAASLVIPDAWMRVTFAAVGDLPVKPAARDEVLRWKLRRLVPFRVDELRLGAVEVQPLPGQAETEGEARRLLLAFALEALLGQLEDAFEGAGIELGQITNASLSALGAVEGGGGRGSREGLTALALVEGESYTLCFARAGEPVLHRHKGVTGEALTAAREGLVRRDLRLTRNFLEEQLPNERLGRVLVAAPPELEPSWLRWAEEGLGEAAEPLRREHLPLTPTGPETGGEPVPSWRELAPMLGAAAQEVA